jgi:hypothetical protein
VILYAKRRKTEVIWRVVVQLKAEKKQNKGSGKGESTKKRKSDEFFVNSDEEMDDADKENEISE